MAIFAHRGLVDAKNNIFENSLASLKNALDAGFIAIEFDIWFIGNQLIISHDEPKNNQLTLFEFLEYSLKNSQKPLFYWLDFKNATLNNATQIALQTKNILEKLKIPLDNCYFAPFITNYELAEQIYLIWQNILGNFMAVIEQESQFLKCQKFIINHKINHLSVNHQLLNNQFIMNSLQNTLPNLNLFAWTIKNLATYLDLQQKQIKNFASDIIL